MSIKCRPYILKLSVSDRSSTDLSKKRRKIIKTVRKGNENLKNEISKFIE